MCVCVYVLLLPQSVLVPGHGVMPPHELCNVCVCVCMCCCRLTVSDLMPGRVVMPPHDLCHVCVCVCMCCCRLLTTSAMYVYNLYIFHIYLRGINFGQAVKNRYDARPYMQQYVHLHTIHIHA
jgi:hypothetical protein